MENARYEVIYSKRRRGSAVMLAWEDTIQEADGLAARLECAGYDVDIWWHTATGARPIYSRNPLLRAQIDAMAEEV